MKLSRACQVGFCEIASLKIKRGKASYEDNPL